MRRSRSSTNIPAPKEASKITIGRSRSVSRSSTNIPVPKEASRAKSASRYRRDHSNDAQTPLAYRLNTPLHRGSGYTPLHRGSGSVSSFGSRGSSTYHNTTPLEKKSMQKFLNDKKWVAEQYSKVHLFIQTSGHFNPELAGAIRPPSINTIIELVTVLFRQLIHKFDPINSQTYANVILSNLKLLKYPGAITLSTMKMINTMHGWPNFISIMSWLIDRVDIGSQYDTFKEQQDADMVQVMNLQDRVMEFFTTLHSIHSQTSPVDEDLLIEKEKPFFEDLSAILGVDHEAAELQEQILEERRAEVSALDSSIEKYTDEIDKIKSEISERLDVIKNFKENKGTREQDLENELHHLKELVLKRQETKEYLLSSIKEVEGVLASQPSRYDEKIAILAQIEDFKRAITRKERKLREYRLVKDELDMKLQKMVTEIERLVDNWNVSITKTFLPEMQNLHLREKGFHTKEFIEELKEIVRQKDEIQNELLKELKNIKFDIDKLVEEKEALVKENKILDETKKQLDSLRSSIESSKKKNRDLLLTIDEFKKKHEIEMIEIQNVEGGKAEESGIELAELEKRTQKLTEENNKMANKSIAILVEAHNMATQGIKKIDDSMLEVLNVITRSAEETRCNLLETVKRFLSTQEDYSNIINSLLENEEENPDKN